MSLRCQRATPPPRRRRRREAEMPEQVLGRRRRAEARHADRRGRAGRRSATSRPGRRPRSRRGSATPAGSTASRQAASCASNTLVQGIETTRTRRPRSSSSRAASTASATSEPVAIRMHSGPARAVGEHVAAAGDVRELRRVARLLRQRLPRQREHGRRLAAADRGAPGDPGLGGVAGPPDFHARNHAQRCEMLDRLVRRPVLAEADRVVRQHEDAARLDDRGHAQRTARVVREHEEGAAERDVAAVQRDAVHDRAHAELAHAVVQIVAVRRRGRETAATP